MLPEKFVIIDTEYGDEDVAAKQEKCACLLSIGALVVQNMEIQREIEYTIKPLYMDQLTPKIMGLTGLTPQHFEEASTAYEPVRQLMGLMRNQYVVSWGHTDSIKIRYWANVFEITHSHFKAVDAFSYLLALDPDVKPRMKNEAERRGFDASRQHSALADCHLLFKILEDQEHNIAEMDGYELVL